MWVEMLEAEEFDAFNEAGNLFDPTTAKRLWRHAYRGAIPANPRRRFGPVWVATPK